MDTAAKAMGGKGEFAIITGSLTAANQNEWLQAHRAAAGGEVPRHQAVAETAPATTSSTKAFERGDARCSTRNPNLKLIMAICSPAVPGAAEAVKQSGRNDVKVVGLGLPNENKAVRPRRHHRHGHPLEHDGPRLPHGPRVQGAGRRATLKPGADDDRRRPARRRSKIEGDNVLLGQPFAFTKENIDQFDF